MGRKARASANIGSLSFRRLAHIGREKSRLKKRSGDRGERVMKRKFISLLLIVCVLTGWMLTLSPAFANAAGGKAEKQRSIAIVFDNSGSMYLKSMDKAWCRAIYAMEVFAAMLNDKDTLTIYPMHEIDIGGSKYSDSNPLKLTGPKDASKIRQLVTLDAQGTPIETIDRAYAGLSGASGEKWLVVLTDGDSFDENEKPFGNAATPGKLNDRFSGFSSDVHVLYLGIGAKAAMPKETANVTVEKASNSADVLAKLTAMCNMIFGRDVLPASHFEKGANKMKTDISLSKLIVFVQGENIADVKVADAAGKEAGTLKSRVSTKYSTGGANNDSYKDAGKDPDTKLQGVIVTYTDVPQGDYTITFSGSSSSVEAYYEPDVEMEFLFTDDEGRTVSPDQLYEGNYTIQFGMKDGKTGEYTDSALLGQTQYSGHYSVNGKEYPIDSAEKSGKVTVELMEGDSFNADMTVRYLSGYEIHREGGEFGWPLSVASRPAGELELRISGGAEEYGLTTLEQGEPFRAEIYYKGEKLTGAELEKAEIAWDPEKSGALLSKVFKDDHYDIVFSHKDPSNPTATPLGYFGFQMYAIYKEQGAAEAKSFPVDFEYTIVDDQVPIQVRMTLTQSYYVISDIADGDPIRAEITMNGAKLTPEEFAEVDFSAKCDGLDFDVKALPDESAYLLYIKDSGKLEARSYRIDCEVSKTDNIGRTMKNTATTSIRLSTVPLWLKWLIALLILIILAILIWRIMKMKVFPKRIYTSNGSLDAPRSINDAVFAASPRRKLKKNGQLSLYASTDQIDGVKFGVKMTIDHGDRSFLYKKQRERSIKVLAKSVIPVDGSIEIKDVTIASNSYIKDAQTEGRIIRSPDPDDETPFEITDGESVYVSGSYYDSYLKPKKFTVYFQVYFTKQE